MCNGVHYVGKWKSFYLCRICNALGYTAKTWPENKLSLNPLKTTEPNSDRLPRQIRDQVNALANQIDPATEKKEAVIVVVHKTREQRVEIGYPTISLLLLSQGQSLRSLVCL